MVSRTDSGTRSLVGVLVAYRIPIYLGGLLVISIPRIFPSVFGVVVPETVSTILVGVSLTVMITTYLVERHVGYDPERESRTGEKQEQELTYPLRLRVALVLSIVGIAAGIYVALEIALFTGLLFIVGAYLFGYFVSQGEFDNNAGDTEEV
jgi:small-conductance mechanosensitive channel